MESMAASTNCSSRVNCYATLRTYLSQLLIHWEQRVQRSKVTEERHSCLPGCRILCNHVGYAHAPDMTRARQRSLSEMACARLIARWLFRLFSRHISGTQLFQENRHVNINVLVAQKPLVPLIGRLVACSARTHTDRRTDKQTKYCNPRCACAPRVNDCVTMCHVPQTRL